MLTLGYILNVLLQEQMIAITDININIANFKWFWVVDIYILSRLHGYGCSNV